MNNKQKVLKKKVLHTAVIGLGTPLIALLIGPFLVPVTPLKDTVPPAQLADTDSRFVQVEEFQVHYKTAGQGQPAIILLHGFGSSLFSWREVMAPLGELSTVLAFDRPAFGLTERPLRAEWGDQNPYSVEFQVDLTVALIDMLGAEQAVLIGNSAGGAISMLTALEHPERVKALILVDPAVYAGGGSPALVRPLLRTPQMRHLGPLIARRIRTWGIAFARSAWHDPTKITDEIWKGYQKPLQVENWDRALWELTAASKPPRLADRLGELTLPILVITGDDDRIVPTEQSIRLAGELPNAELVVIPNCGHVPHEECPQAFLDAAMSFLDRVLHNGER
ncbi:MAG: alpha/beta hydrolase [Anaerolineae bacterium]|nr:alpha/beta hydrolase [Anaerolineae bacterium]